MKTPNKIHLDSAVDRLERELFVRVIRGEFKAGEFLPSMDRLATIFGVSVTTVRSAVGRLAGKGLVVFVQGQGFRVEELLRSCDVEVLLRLIEDKSQVARSLELESQLLDLMSIVFLEVIARAVVCRTTDHLKWFNHYLRILLDRIDLDAHIAYVAEAQFQLLRVLAGAAGSIAFTVLVNSFRAYLRSPAGLELFPPDTWNRLAKAMEDKDVGTARQLLQRCFDVRLAKVLGLLAKTRGAAENADTHSDDALKLEVVAHDDGKHGPH
jgi:DNA-binding GntR family transcriptional regulator